MARDRKTITRRQMKLENLGQTRSDKDVQTENTNLANSTDEVGVVGRSIGAAAEKYQAG